METEDRRTEKAKGKKQMAWSMGQRGQRTETERRRMVNGEG
jgi:hypothetical protein